MRMRDSPGARARADVGKGVEVLRWRAASRVVGQIVHCHAFMVWGIVVVVVVVVVAGFWVDILDGRIFLGEIRFDCGIH